MRQNRPHRLVVLLAAGAIVATVSFGPAAGSLASTAVSPRSTATSPAPVQVPGGFVPVPPTRLLDTRTDLGATGPVPSQHAIDVAVAGAGPIPATGVEAVVVNLTVTHTLSSGFLTAYPTGATRPRVSNLNFVAGQTVANLATIQLHGGKLSVYNGSAGSDDILADVTGFYLSGSVTAPGAFTALTPARILDTRTGLGAPEAQVIGNDTLTLTVGGQGGVPAAGVSAVVLNVTVTRPRTKGYLTAYATGSARPKASNLNFVRGATVPNLVTTAVSAGGQVTFYNGSGAEVDLVADVAGYYLAGTATRAGAFVPVIPTRFVDSRTDQVISEFVTAGATFSAQAVNLGGTGAGHIGGVPAGNVAAVVTNVTAISEQQSGFITAYPAGPSRPSVSTLNHEPGVARANAAVVGVGTCGQVSFYNGSGGWTGMVVDTSGYFLAGDSTAPPTPSLPVEAWGDGYEGSLGNGNLFDHIIDPAPTLGVSDVTAITANDQVLAIRTDGSVMAWGPMVKLGLARGGGPGCSIPQVVPGLTDVTSVAAGELASYALTSDGTVWAWGDNDEGELGDGTTTDRQTPQPVPGLTDVTAIASGWRFALALRSDGTVWGWGEETSGELGGGFSHHAAPVQVAPATLTGITAIGAGYLTGYAVTADGHVYAWGSNGDGQLGNGTTAGPGAHPSPSLVSGVTGTGTLSGVTQVAGGVGYTPMALRSDHSVVAWGSNTGGLLGDGNSAATQPRSLVPVSVLGLTNVTAVAPGFTSAAALESDGTVWTWGATPGDAAATARSTPAKVDALSGVSGIAQGRYGGYAILP